MSGTNEPILVHGVRASSEYWMSLWNFQLAGTRASIDLANREFGAIPTRDMDLDVLRGSPAAWPSALLAMALSPFLMLIWQGGLLRSGGRIGFGVPPYDTRWVDDPQTTQRVIEAADRELALEETRRAVAPEAPSRLSAVYCAENTPAGRNWVEEMLGPESFLVRVRIKALVAFARCDARWLDQWRDEDARRAYWTQVPSDDPRWEILVEGVIEAADAEELQRLRAYVKTVGPPLDLIPGRQPGQNAGGS